MASKITNISELFHRFHHCEMQLRQGKIAACLIAFKEVIESIPAIPKTDKEKGELHQGLQAFLKNLSEHKKIKEIFGEVSFGDTDLETNLEFIKSMIVAQEEDIVERYKKDEEAADALRLDMANKDAEKQAETKKKIEQAIKYIDEENLPPAMEIVNESEEIREAVILYYNNTGMQQRENKSFEEAIKSYEKAISLSPEDENLQYNIARAYYEEGKRDKAEEYLDKAMKLNPQFHQGKTFYDYLLKLDHSLEKNTGTEKKTGGFFQKIFFFKKSRA